MGTEPQTSARGRSINQLFIDKQQTGEVVEGGNSASEGCEESRKRASI